MTQRFRSALIGATTLAVWLGLSPTAGATISVVDVIPKADSRDSGQNAEPSLALNPIDPSQMVAAAFSDVSSPNGLVTPYFASTDGGKTWTDYGSLLTLDKSIAWSTDGTSVLTAVDTPTFFGNGIGIGLYSGTVPGPGPTTAVSVLNANSLFDQPSIATGPTNHVYVGYNNLDKFPGSTATIAVSTDGGATLTPIAIDPTNPGGQSDAPAIRVAVNGNTVYGAYIRWNANLGGDPALQSADIAAQIMVVKSTNGGADSFTALPGGSQVDTPVVIFSEKGAALGSERIGSDLSIAVDPNNPNRVVVAYSGTAGLGELQVVVAESTDGGVTWTRKFTSSNEIRSGLPAIVIRSDGAVGLLYTSYDVAKDRLSQHLISTNNDFQTFTDTLLAHEQDQASGGPTPRYFPYIGDFQNLTSAGSTYYGIFSADNFANGRLAAFPEGVSFLRCTTGVIGTLSFGLDTCGGIAIPQSIDPFMFSASGALPNNGGGGFGGTVPEPATIAVFGAGLFGLAVRRARSPGRRTSS